MTPARIPSLVALSLGIAGVLLALSVDGPAEGGTSRTWSVTAQRGRPHKPPPHPTKLEVGSKDGGAAGSESLKANPDAGIVEAKTLDGGTRVFRFGEMEVEGRLRSPQIVYFLRRVRAEFAAGDLGHRSFMGELSDTRRSNAF